MKDSVELLVLVRRGASRALPPCDPALPGLLGEGWTVAWDAAPSVIEGWSYAAIHHGALPADLDDRMGARPIASPTVLFRSVSIPEMADIVRRGEVRGGGNDFNPWDRRPLVFFSGEITPRVVRQGEEIDRAVSHALKADPAHRALMALPAERDAFVGKIEEGARLRVAAANAARAARGRHPVEISDADWADFRNVNSRAFKDFMWLIPEAERKEIEAGLREFSRAQDGLLEELRIVHGARSREMADQLDGMSFTSAVIETRPIGVGLHFSGRFGRSGMGEEDEYGLFPGQVTLDDIVAVHWVRRGTILETSPVGEAPSITSALEQERLGFSDRRGPRP